MIRGIVLAMMLLGLLIGAPCDPPEAPNPTPAPSAVAPPPEPVKEDTSWMKEPWAPLRGLGGASVIVEDMSEDAERDGLTRDVIQTDVELRLRKSGIPVLRGEEAEKMPNWPSLHVNVFTLKNEKLGFYAYHLSAQLREWVFLARGRGPGENRVNRATTWYAQAFIGTVAATDLRGIRENIADMVDNFINAYLAANPKKEK